MNVIVTCGPSFEPIDEVRRLTNFSTGELGVILARHLAAAGHDVDCLKGRSAPWPGPEPPCRVEGFDTNADLLERLRALARLRPVGAVFHAAALCDYRVRALEDGAGQPVRSAKLDTRAGGLVLHLEPAPKVIVELRSLFPSARLVGWKYELTGTRETALASARRQLETCATDACVLNGRAAGEGFTLVRRDGSLAGAASKTALAQLLERELARGPACGDGAAPPAS